MANKANGGSPTSVSLPPGFLKSRRAEERLSLFQDLVRHHQRWGHQIRFARPIEELLPPNTPPNDRYPLLEREIQRLIPLIREDLRAAGVLSVFSMTSKEFEYDFEKGKQLPHETTQTYDVVRDYFLLPHDNTRAKYFDLLMAVLEQGIGFYLETRRSALRRKLNPVSWLACVIRFPVLVLEAGGLEGQAGKSAVYGVYAWLLRLVILAILALIATKLGVSIPWRQLVALLK